MLKGAAMIRTKGEAGTGDIVNAVTHMRAVFGAIRQLQAMRDDELYAAAKEHRAPYELVRWVAENGRLPVVTCSSTTRAGSRTSSAARAPSSRRRRTSTTRRCSPTCRAASARRWWGSRRARYPTRSGSKYAAGRSGACAALEGLDGLVIPGGESTTIASLAEEYGLDDAIRAFAEPILGTCAGMIVLDREHLAVADLVVDRNAYGRQVRSFEADVELGGDERPLRGVFIRAPRIRELGPGVEVLGTLDGEPVLVRDGRLLLAAFHPELTDDTRVHERFLELVRVGMDEGEASLAPTNGR